MVSSSVNDRLSATFTFTPKMWRTDKFTAAADAVIYKANRKPTDACGGSDIDNAFKGKVASFAEFVGIV